MENEHNKTEKNDELQSSYAISQVDSINWGLPCSFAEESSRSLSADRTYKHQTQNSKNFSWLDEVVKHIIQIKTE